MALIHPGDYAAPLRSGDRLRLLPGLVLGYIEETVIPTGLAAYDLQTKLPVQAIVLACEIQLQADVTATTAVKVGVGRKETTADPDKYALTPDLDAGTYRGTKVTITPVLADALAPETLQVCACATNGSAAGTLDGGGPITVKLWYQVTEIW